MALLTLAFLATLLGLGVTNYLNIKDIHVTNVPPSPTPSPAPGSSASPTPSGAPAQCPPEQFPHLLTSAVYAPLQQVPPGPTLAVGNNVILLAGRPLFDLYDKQTLGRLLNQDYAVFLPPYEGQSAYSAYDPPTSRFFFCTLNAQYYTATVTLPSTSFYAARIAESGPQTWSPLGAAVVQSVPANADPAILNGGALAGNIALIVRDPLVAYTVQILRAQAEGAVAVIIYNNVPGLFDVSGFDGSILIPSVGITQSAGADLISNLPTLATLGVLTETHYLNDLAVAVSRNSDPRGDVAWDRFSDRLPNNVFRNDEVRCAASQVGLVVTMLNYNADATVNGSRTIVYNKQLLLDGTSLTVTEIQGHEGSALIWPARQLFQRVDQLLPAFGVATNGDATDGSGQTALTVRVANAFLVPITVPFLSALPTNPTQAAPQPTSARGLEAVQTVYFQPVVFEQSLWTCQTYAPDASRIGVRCYELDLSTYTTDGTITLRQQFDVTPDDGASALTPSVAVNQRGDLVVCFTLSGLTTWPSVACTYRLAADPLNTVRAPYVVLLAGQFSYDDGQPTAENGWGRFSTTVIDPVDRETFYMTAEYPSQASVDVDPFQQLSYVRNVMLARFTIEQLQCAQLSGTYVVIPASAPNQGSSGSGGMTGPPSAAVASSSGGTGYGSSGDTGGYRRR